MFSRRQTIRLMSDAAAGIALTGCATGSSKQSQTAPLAPDRKWLAKLGQGLPEEFDYAAKIEGRLPAGLSGTLYRNGPGLFERNGFRKWNLLDGDGMIRATSFAGGQAHFRNRFVRTSKYLDEGKAGEFIFPTWTTPAPGFFANIPCIPNRSQAGVTPVIKDGVLYAFDEVGAPYAINAATLETMREIDPYDGAEDTGPANYKAHTKTDGVTGDWILVGQRGRVNPELHVVVKDRAGRQARHVVQRSPRGSAYFHDFFWADPYVVFHLHPALLSPLPMLAGLRPFVDSLQWQPEQGSILFVVDTTGVRAPVTVEAPASWMWHALNAYRLGDAIVADFVGYDAPDHFLGPDASFRTIMQGREGIANAPGTLRRLTIDLSGKQARLETVSEGWYEFPFIPQSRVGRVHRYGYVASHSSGPGWFHDGLARINTDSGAQAAFHFGPDYYVGEPVFVPDPDAATNPAVMEDRGWLLCEVLEGKSETSFIAVFDVARLQEGPVAKLRLHHHLPMSFHGWWQAA
jgi:all-trans-8'-apo-beta-carotenal 15,15'-oxygenase